MAEAARGVPFQQHVDRLRIDEVALVVGAAPPVRADAAVATGLSEVFDHFEAERGARQSASRPRLKKLL